MHKPPSSYFRTPPVGVIIQIAAALRIGLAQIAQLPQSLLAGPYLHELLEQLDRLDHFFEASPFQR